MPNASVKTLRPGWLPAFAIAGALLMLGTAVEGQTAYGQAPAPRTRVPKEVLPLLSTDVDTWMQGLAELRRNPQGREFLLQGLEVQPAPERRWRLIHHLAEFGGADDAAVLVPLLDGMPEGLERRVLLGTLRTLYPVPADAPDLTTAVKDFAFLQTAPPAPLPSDSDNKYVLTDLALQTYWLDRVPPQVMERVLPLKGRRFDSHKALAEALQSRLTPRLWQDNGERLLAPLSAAPARLMQDGVLRYKVENTLKRPLVLMIDVAVWHGRLGDHPPRRFLYLKPGEAQQLDLPVRVLGPKEPGRVRIDLNARELNGPRIPLNSKLYVSMQG